MSDERGQLEDYAVGLRERLRNRFRVAVAEAGFDFRELELQDPVPTGRQLAEAAGFRPAEDHLVFQVLDDGTTQ